MFVSGLCTLKLKKTSKTFSKNLGFSSPGGICFHDSKQVLKLTVHVRKQTLFIRSLLSIERSTFSVDYDIHHYHLFKFEQTGMQMQNV